jgi:hypothetical protein
LPNSSLKSRLRVRRRILRKKVRLLWFIGNRNWFAKLDAEFKT